MEPQLMPTGEPFFFPGSRTGCLLVHGITATPKEMRYLGRYLNQKGYSVLGVRLAGHATAPQDLLGIRWQDWINSIADGHHLLRSSCDKVFIIGLSMGGVLSLIFADQYPVDGVVAMATPYSIPLASLLEKLSFPILGLVGKLVPFMKKSYSPWYNPEAQKHRIAYDLTVIPAVNQLKKAISVMRQAIPHISIPVLVIHSSDDDFVPPYNATTIFQHLTGTQDKTLLYTEESDHVITEDGDREKVFNWVANFVERIEII